MATRWKCPHCFEETTSLIKQTTDEKGKEDSKLKQFIFPMTNKDGTVNWKNVFHIDWLSIGIIIGILLLVYGVKQINQQCYDIVEHPCEHLDKLGCNEVMNGETLRTQDYGGNSYPTGDIGSDSGEG